MRILAIETSCDETALALIEAKGGLRRPIFKVEKNLISSQVKVHEPYGGVVPNLAKREHIKNLPLLLQQIFPTLDPETLNSKQFQNSKDKSSQRLKSVEIDAIAVTVGPGLEPALWTGINFAKKLGKKLNKPVIGANHLEGHIYSNWLPNGNSRKTIAFPAVVLLVSGGHTILLKMDSLTKWKKLGETRDDAAGEAFDKVARLLGLPYPGGPQIEIIAKKGNPKAIAFPRPMLKDKNYDFSFSGLKTAVLYYLRDYDPSEIKKAEFMPNVAASFQQAVIDVLVGKTIRAAKEHRAKSVLLCGGVSANKALQNNFKNASKKIKADFFSPPMAYNTDNAAMIGAAAYIQNLREIKRRLIAQANLSL